MKSSRKYSLALAASAIAMTLAACASPTAAPQPTKAPEAPKAAEPTKAPAPAAPAAVPTLAAAPTVPPPPAGKKNVSIYLDADTNITDWYINVLIPAFEKQYPQYKANLVNVKGVAGTTRSIVDRSLAALQTNSDPQVEVMEFDVTGYPESEKAGLWLKLDASNVANSKDVLKAAFVSQFNMPYRGSQVLLAYDSAKIKDADVPRTFPALMEWVKKNPGQFTYGRPDKGGSGGNFVVRALYEATGNDPSIFKPGEPDPAILAKFDKAWEMLRGIHDYTFDKGSYPAGNQPALLLLSNGSVSMVSAWSDQVLQGVANGVLPPTIKMAQFTDLPMPGGYSQYAIPKNSANVEGALAWVNWTLDQQQQIDVIKRIGGFPAVTWDKLPADLRTQFNSVITDKVPSWPGGKWGAARDKGWYEKVATNIKQ